MSIGYACLCVGVPDTKLKTCIQANATKENLNELIQHNLLSLENIIDYNIKNGIKLFRISSDIIPFGSSPVNSLNWRQTYASRLSTIGEKIRRNGIRVSMHPGQYTVMNSPNPDVVRRAVDDLKYHTEVLESLGVSSKHKIILHIGGMYGDKKLASERFIRNYLMLDGKIKERLVIENDDKCYNIGDVIDIAEKSNMPVIYDNLHNQLNPCDDTKSDTHWINRCKNSWALKDGCQKIHYSQQDNSRKAGSHSNSINAAQFVDFYQGLRREDIDIMLEVKDKNLSAVKCINCISPEKRIGRLENEWSKYKYSVLEKSKNDYDEARFILKNKSAYPVLDFYRLVENALNRQQIPGSAVNAALHVWGYFKDTAQEKEKDGFFNLLDAYQNGAVSLGRIKRYLFKLTQKYNQEYLLNSYYFVL
jgi:UV DNA damage endonuclease